MRGWVDTQLVVRIEAVRRELSVQQAGRAGVDPYRDLPYWLVVLGDPTSTDPWAWRINGHHLLAQATVVGDQVSGVPHFFGAEPATVLVGPHAGLRALPREEDLAQPAARLRRGPAGPAHGACVTDRSTYGTSQLVRVTAIRGL